MSARFALLVVLAAACASPAAFAQDDDDAATPRPRFELSAGAFFASTDADLRADSATLGRGTTINLSNDLGFDPDETAGRVEAIWRFGNERRQRVDVSYFRLSRQAQRAINREIQFRDDVFTIDTEIRAELDLDIFKLDYTYMFFQTENAEIGGSVGVFGIVSRASLDATNLGEAETSDVTFPLPTLGVRGDFGLSHHFRLKGSADVFFIDTGEYNGELYDFLAALELDVTEHFGVGLGYNYANLRVGASRTEGDVDLDISYDGPLLYAKVMF